MSTVTLLGLHAMFAVQVVSDAEYWKVGESYDDLTARYVQDRRDSKTSEVPDVVRTVSQNTRQGMSRYDFASSLNVIRNWEWGILAFLAYFNLNRGSFSNVMTSCMKFKHISIFIFASTWSKVSNHYSRIMWNERDTSPTCMDNHARIDRCCINCALAR